VSWRDRGLAFAILALTLPMMPVTGLVTPYILDVFALLLLIVLAVRGGLAALYRAPGAVLFLAVFVVLLVSFALSAHQVADVRYAFNFTAFILYAPLFAVLTAAAGPEASRNLARLALVAALIGLAAAIVGRVVFENPRASLPTIGPLRLANTTILFGMLALIGFACETGRRRLPYLLGPASALMVIALTGARGALLASAPLALLALVFLGRGGRWKWALATGIALLAAGGVASMGLASDRILSLFGIAGHIAEGQTVSDPATYVRLTLYRGALSAFLDSPWIGHGWARLMSSLTVHLAPADQQYASFPHLHDDMLDFAVSAGVVGIIAYLALIAGPVIVALRSVKDSQYANRVYGTLALAATYVLLGLTDLMFGFAYNTTLYVATAAILLGYCRDQPWRPALARPAAGGRAAHP